MVGSGDANGVIPKRLKGGSMLKFRGLALAVALVCGFTVMGQAMQDGTITLLGLQEEIPKCRFIGDSLVPAGLSFVIPGLGQFANGQDGKGFLHLGVALALPTAFYLMVNVFGNPLGGYNTLALLFPALQLGWHAFSSYDAYSVNQEYCSGS